MVKEKIVKNAVKSSDGVYDADTGKKLEYGVWVPDEVREKRKEYVLNRIAYLEAQLVKTNLENKAFRKKLGIEDDEKNTDNFIWLLFKNEEVLFPEIKKQDVCKLTYASTYIDYKRNRVNNKRRPLTRKSMRLLMKLDNTIFDIWFKSMTERKLIEVKEDGIYIKKQWFRKGNLKFTPGYKAIRVFTESFREAYLNQTPYEHFLIGELIRLIPFINPHFNCLSYNLIDQDPRELSERPITDMDEIWGHCVKHCRQLERQMLGLRISPDGEPFAILAALDETRPDVKFFVINPSLFFGGSVEEQKSIASLFSTAGN